MIDYIKEILCSNEENEVKFIVNVFKSRGKFANLQNKYSKFTMNFAENKYIKYDSEKKEYLMDGETEEFDIGHAEICRIYETKAYEYLTDKFPEIKKLSTKVDELRGRYDLEWCEVKNKKLDKFQTSMPSDWGIHNGGLVVDTFDDCGLYDKLTLYLPDEILEQIENYFMNKIDYNDKQNKLNEVVKLIGDSNFWWYYEK